MGTPLGLIAKRSMDAGELVPDDVVIELIRDRLTGGASAAYLLDGFPRTIRQAEVLDEMLGDLGAPIDHVLLLSVPREELLRRLGGRWLCHWCGRSWHEVFAPVQPGQCGRGGDCELYQRDDDRPAAIEHRLEVYDAQTAPLVQYYTNQGLLREIRADMGQDEVYGQITQAIAGR